MSTDQGRLKTAWAHVITVCYCWSSKYRRFVSCSVQHVWEVLVLTVHLVVVSSLLMIETGRIISLPWILGGIVINKVSCLLAFWKLSNVWCRDNHFLRRLDNLAIADLDMRMVTTTLIRGIFQLTPHVNYLFQILILLWLSLYWLGIFIFHDIFLSHKFVIITSSCGKQATHLVVMQNDRLGKVLSIEVWVPHYVTLV